MQDRAVDVSGKKASIKREIPKHAHVCIMMVVFSALKGEWSNKSVESAVDEKLL